ncbi:MAG: carboxypeptidase regulatory-like domain-containing protein [Anaerolineales bacterium]|nr:carboxypeptidase regulatory-like domain-containing protein [Anaerolineales bacterium]
MPKFLHLRWIITLIMLLLAALLFWLATTDSSSIWPYRNTLQYYALTWWWQQAGYPQPGEPGELGGVVRDTQGQPVAGAWVLVSWWDGTSYSARSEADGSYLIAAVPAGQYRPVAGAPGYDSIEMNRWVTISPQTITTADLTLPPEPLRSLTPGQNLSFGPPSTPTCADPLPATAIRQPFTFDNNGRPGQPALYYTPLTTTTTSRLPVLMIVYPGPADAWDCASLPLAAAGYAVVALGPAYSLELEADIDELERVAAFIRAGQFPGGDGSRLAVLGGSYSGLHAQRLLQRSPHYEAAILLGPPTDLFDMRRRLEERSYIPPFGLDQVLVALGLPDREPLRYWRYSGAYHIRPDFPPLAIMHSRTDEVVPFQQSERLSANLTQMGVAHQTYFFDGASHYLLAAGGDKDTLEIYRLTLEFLAEHLK